MTAHFNQCFRQFCCRQTTTILKSIITQICQPLWNADTFYFFTASKSICSYAFDIFYVFCNSNIFKVFTVFKCTVSSIRYTVWNIYLCIFTIFKSIVSYCYCARRYSDTYKTFAISEDTTLYTHHF